MISLLSEAKREIDHLHRRNEVLEAQVGIVEVFAAALGLSRNTGGAMHPDISWQLQQKINELEVPSKISTKSTGGASGGVSL